MSKGGAANASKAVPLANQAAAKAPAFPDLPDSPEFAGLSDEQVTQQISEGHTNALPSRTSRTYGQIIRENVFTLFNAIILTAMALVLITGDWKDSVFGLVVIINSGIGIFTEIRAKRALDRLTILTAAKPFVRRAGHNSAISSDQIVLGDLLWIRAGEQVPADGVLLRSWGLEMDESMLTGESRTVRKPADARVLSGSTAVSGTGLARVTQVGESSYAAKLTAQAKVYKKTHSDLQDGINTILKWLTWLVVPLCALLMWSQMRDYGGLAAAIASGKWRPALVSAVAGIVGMIPEGLVLLTSLNFALSAIYLAQRNTLIQQLESVETLARVDCLNLDKTGTITDGRIVFSGFELLPSAQSRGIDGVAAQSAALAVMSEESPNATGAAIISALTERGIQPMKATARVPFSSARKWSAILDDSSTIWVCGAPEILLRAMDGDYSDIQAQVSAAAARGERVLLLATGNGFQSGEGQAPVLPSDLTPVALLACSESIRPDAAQTLAYFRRQGVRCRMISGDNPRTVAAIAQRVDLMGDGSLPRYMDAHDLPSDTADLAAALENIDVLGRVLPDQKKAIVDALHLSGHVVAMTGDGVNDALAIKEADLGIAMGSAAPATKSVADVVLVDSKFSHLPSVVGQGRRVMANIERVASLFLVKTSYSAVISIGVVLLGLMFPYLPRHMTYISALTIGIPAFILSLAPNDTRYRKGFLSRVLAFSIPSGVAIGVCVLALSRLLPAWMGWSHFVPHDLAVLRTMCAALVFCLAIIVLGKVSKPLMSWRGILVLVMAAVGVAGALIAPVARFFAIVLPADVLWRYFALGLLASILVFLAIEWVVRAVVRRTIGVPAERKEASAQRKE